MFDQIAEGVFRRRYDSLDLNVGVVLGDDGMLVIDTRSTHREAIELRDELKTLSRLPVKWVINTHWHFDHAFGNSVFDEAEIWGHELCQVALSTHGEDMRPSAKDWLPVELHHEIDEVEIVSPTNTFSERASLDIGRHVEMAYHGLGHTDADIVIRVRGAGVVFLGDLVEEGGPPNFGDSHPVAWPLTLRLACEDLPGVVVPGHGDIVDPAFIEAQHRDLVAVAELATSFVMGEVELEEAIRGGPYPVEVLRTAMLRAQAVA